MNELQLLFRWSALIGGNPKHGDNELHLLRQIARARGHATTHTMNEVAALRAIAASYGKSNVGYMNEMSALRAIVDGMGAKPSNRNLHDMNEIDCLWAIIRAGGGAEIAADTEYTEGQIFETSFTDSVADALVWDLSGFTYITDGATPVLHLTAPGTPGLIHTKVALADSEVLIKMRHIPEGAFTAENIATNLHARYVDASNNWQGQALATAGNNQLVAYSDKAGVRAGSTGSGIGTYDNVDTTTYRWLKIRMTGDIIRFKWWFVGSAEPDWQIVEWLRRATGGPSPNTTTDNIQSGPSGLLMLFGGYLQYIKVTELVRSDASLIYGPYPREIETNAGAFPVGWYKVGADADNTRTIVSIPDPTGATKPVFKLIRTDVTEEDNNYYTQDLWKGGTPNVFITRTGPWPLVTVPEYADVTIWSKGDTVANAGGTIATSMVMYYYNDDGDILNTGQADYYATLGPNGAVNGAAVSKKGDGTWNWYKTTWRIHFNAHTTVTRIRIDIGFHDATATGTLWFTYPQIIPVP